MTDRPPGWVDPTLPEDIFEPKPTGDASVDLVADTLRTSWRNFMVRKLVSELMWMAKRNIIPEQDIIRVQVNDDGTVDLLDFGMPPEIEGRKKERIPQSEVPTWIMEAISMLRIAPENDLVPGLGFKVSDTLYFVSTNKGESDGGTG